MKAHIPIRRFYTVTFTCFLTLAHFAHPVYAQDLSAPSSVECVKLEGATDTSILTQASVSDGYRAAHNLATGHGVRVAVIDTGVADHPRLRGVEDGGNLVGDSFDGLFDCDAHGTIVASVIGAHDAGDGIVGVAPDANIISIRQSTTLRQNGQGPEESGGSLQTLIDALNVALDKGADVINVSVVSCIPPGSPPVDLGGLDRALGRAESQNSIVVSAAGNASTSCPHGSTVYPAHHEKVVGVAAHVDPATITDYSIASPLKLVSAPGYVATALSPDGHGLASGTTQNGNVNDFAGTSFAAPFVAGTVALMKQRSPQASAATIRRVLFESADPLTGAVDPTVAVSMLTEADPQEHRISVAPQTLQEKTSAKNAALILAAICVFLLLLAIGQGTSRRQKQAAS